MSACQRGHPVEWWPGASAGRIAGLPAAGLRYSVQFELIRPAQGSPRSRTGAGGGQEPGPAVLPRRAAEPRSTGRRGRRRRPGMSGRRGQGLPTRSGPLVRARPVADRNRRRCAPRPPRAPARRSCATSAAGSRGAIRAACSPESSQGAFFVDTFIAEGFNRDPGSGACRLPGRDDGRRRGQLDGHQPAGPGRSPNAVSACQRAAALLAAHAPPAGEGSVPGRRGRGYTDFYRLRAGLTDARRAPPRACCGSDWPSPTRASGPRHLRSPLQRRPSHRAQPAAQPALPARAGRRPCGRPPAAPAALPPRAGPPPAPRSTALPGVRRARAPHRRRRPAGRRRALPRGRPAARAPAAGLAVARGDHVERAVCGNSGGSDPFAPAAVAARGSQAR